MTRFEISRSAVVAADPARVWDLVADLRQWPTWSPWEAGDPDLQRSWGGAPQGVGATYTWRGSRRAGAGSMSITRATPERIDVAVVVEKPLADTHETVFALEATPAGETTVTWSMRGERSGVAAVLARLARVDRFLARDLERGLDRLAEVARP